MASLKSVPVARALHRYYLEITRPAPLSDFRDYDDYWSARIADGRVSAVLDRHRIVARLLPDSASVLDIGCGDGTFLRHRVSTRPDCRVEGADISQVAIEQLRAAGTPGYVIDSSAELSAQVPAGWDAIVMMEVIEHMIDSEQMVREAIALKPGRLYITVPNVGFILHRLRLVFGRFPVTTIIYHMKEHVRFWTVKDFTQWADYLGLVILSCHGQVDRRDRALGWLGRRWPSLFADRVVYELAIKNTALLRQ